MNAFKLQCKIAGLTGRMHSIAGMQAENANRQQLQDPIAHDSLDFYTCESQMDAIQDQMDSQADQMDAQANQTGCTP